MNHEEDIQNIQTAALALERMMNRREMERRAERRDARGKLRPRYARNRTIRAASQVTPVPGDRRGAEIWTCYTPMREEWLRMREDPECAALKFTLSICDPDALNGYVAFPKRHAPRLSGYDGLVQYIPVHGGVTYACKDSIAAVWGFDTGHYNSEKEPRTERFWVEAQVMVLYRGLILAEQLWPEFRRASQGRRAELAQQLLDLVPEQELLDKLGLGAMLNSIMGRIG